MTKRERAGWFHDALMHDYYQWRAGMRQPNWRGVRFRGNVTKLGAVRAIKQLLNSPKNRRLNSKEYGAELLVVKKQFRPLFSPDEIKEARRRLRSKN